MPSVTHVHRKLTISRLTGYGRKTVRKHLIQPDGAPVYGPRAQQPGKLTSYLPYLLERMQAGVWNARVVLRELRERGYTGGYTLVDVDASLIETHLRKRLGQRRRVHRRAGGAELGIIKPT